MQQAWQQQCDANLPAGKVISKDQLVIDQQELAECVLEMARIKQCQGSLAIIILILPEFKRMLCIYLELVLKLSLRQSNSEIDFGAMRIALKNPSAFKQMVNSKETKTALTEAQLNDCFIEVDEIELEPIPVNDDDNADGDIMDDDLSNPYRLFEGSQDSDYSMDCLIFSQSPSAAMVGNNRGPRPQNMTRHHRFSTGGLGRGGYMQHNMLSSIPEESSIKEMDFVTSSVVSDGGKERGGLCTSYGVPSNLKETAGNDTNRPLS